MDDELEAEVLDEALSEEEEAQGVPVWAKVLVAVLVLVGVGVFVFLQFGQTTSSSTPSSTSPSPAPSPAAPSPSPAPSPSSSSESATSLCDGGGLGGSDSSTTTQPDPEGCDKVVKYDLVRKRCPLGWRPKRRQDSSICCVYAPEMFSQRDEAVRGSNAFVISVNITAGLATELVLPWAMKKALARIAAKGVKLGTRLINKMILSGSRVLIKVAASVVSMATKAAAAGAMVVAKFSAGPPGWVLILFQVMTMILDFWDPMNYNAFEANRMFIAARNTMITGFHSAMAQANMEPPFIFPLVMAFPKEFEAAYSDVILRATSNFLLTLCEAEQTLFWSSMFTGEEDLSPKERQVLARINRDMEAAAGNMEPRVRDAEIYKRMCLLVGAENLWFDETLSTPTRIAVSVSAGWAQAYNDRAAAIHTQSGEGAANRFVPMISFSKYWYVPDGSKTVEVLLGLGNVNEWIGAAAGLISESAGEAIAPVSTVPAMRRVEHPTGRTVPQYNLMGQFKYTTCMGTRECDKVVLTGPLCKATIQPRFDYSAYGVNFDDDKLMCQYTCRLCERFGLRFTDFDDPTITNVPNATITDCEMYPGQDFMELVLGTTLTRMLVSLYQIYARIAQMITNLAIAAYNAICDAMKPGSGGWCPQNCDDPSACAPETCRNNCKNNVVSRTICDGIDWVCVNGCKGGVSIAFGVCKACFWCRGCEGTRDRGYAHCENWACGKICRTVTEYTIDQACYGVCEGACRLAQMPGICEARELSCNVVGALCDWTGRPEAIPTDCSFAHW